MAAGDADAPAELVPPLVPPPAARPHPMPAATPPPPESRRRQPHHGRPLDELSPAQTSVPQLADKTLELLHRDPLLHPLVARQRTRRRRPAPRRRTAPQARH